METNQKPRNNLQARLFKARDKRINDMKTSKSSLSEEQRLCPHDYRTANAQSVPLKEYRSPKISDELKAQYPGSPVICTRCETIYECNNIAPDKVQEMHYLYQSMLEQIKHLSPNLPDSEIDAILQCYDALEVLKHLENYYIDMVNKLADNDGGKKKKYNNGGGKAERTQRAYGITPGMYGGRKY